MESIEDQAKETDENNTAIQSEEDDKTAEEIYEAI